METNLLLSNNHTSINDPILKERIDSILGESIPPPFTSLEESWPDSFSPSPLVTLVKTIINTPCEKLNKSPFIFERSKKAAFHNSEMIINHNGDLNDLMMNLDRSFTHYGSEFRSIHLLDSLFKKHSKWNKLRSIITEGIKYPIDPISDEDRLNDIEFHLDRGNHQSASSDEGLSVLNKAYDREVKLGWQIPILPSAIKLIKNASITPLGIAQQWSFNSNNERVLKKRITHDCSFPGASGKSPNLRIPFDLLEDCLYGFALLRLLHSFHQMRYRHKKKRVLCTKTDMDSAYRRLHVFIDHALSCITVVVA